MDDRELCAMLGTTLEQVLGDVDKYDAGDLSGMSFAEPIDGRPKVEFKTASIKVPAFELVAIDAAARKEGISRSAFIRRAIDNELLALA